MGVCAWVRTLFVYYSGLKLSSQCKTLISILSRVYATFDYNAQKVFKIPNLFDHAKPNSNYVNKATPRKFEMKWTFHMAHYWYKLKQEKILWSFRFNFEGYLNKVYFTCPYHEILLFYFMNRSINANARYGLN